jgi:ABC-type molybdate transport system substrate-binding protein
MVDEKNRGFQMRPTPAHVLGVALALVTMMSVGCERRATEPVVMVASSLSVLIDRWAKEEARGVRWQGAGSQRITQWLEGGARPLFSILATSKYIQPLRARGLITWTLTLGCSELSLVQVEPERGAVASPLTLEEWRAWGERLSAGDRVALTAEEVPLGRLSSELLRRSEGHFGAAWRRRVLGAVVTQPLSASSTATMLMTGEVDASLLFKVMRYGRPKLSFRDLPPQLQTEVSYIAVGVEAEGKLSAERFRSWLKGHPALGVTPCAQAGSAGAEGISP